ncbi:anthranilate phosphoribosyltransferase [Gallaecimonas xiamenensis]|uniref:Anthranilate phosphoribosyltransferase n=1 Tax=Gallaecimonas xiamenensis 3-C-1 TaxID=745411 RepID=K2ILC9_9GAMM|nr:anthranilate phosphoribosyltransferase [Gallaecimonas xiamenensis]EKE70946.1 anthranilate phosphoribosyltransferase [Gallaecimonas xiamenensis 3-C-1]
MSLPLLFKGQTLSADQAQAFFAEMAAGRLEPVELAAALTAMKIRGETSEELQGLAQALLAAANPFPRPHGDIVDCCGTGGDGANTLNISTTAAFVAAAAGVKVAKHGNRAVSSQSGSTDVLGALGIPVQVPPPLALRALEQANLCFLAAPQYHPGIAHAMPVRKALKTRTLFNLVGPLVNPARPNFQLMGVYDPALLEMVAQALLALGVERGLVVHGSGLDELALHGPTQVVEIRDGALIHYQLTPEDLDLTPATLDQLAGGDAAFNARALEKLLARGEPGPYFDAVAANAGALLYLADLTHTLKEGVAKAGDIIRSGQAQATLNLLKEILRGDSA